MVSVVDRRAKWARFFFLILASVSVTRLAYLQIMEHPKYEALANGQHELYKKIFPKRGEVFFHDTEGTLIPAAMNKTKYRLYTVPREMTNTSKVGVTHAQDAAEALSLILGVPSEILLAQLTKPNDPYEPLQNGLEEADADAVRALNIAGVYLTPELSRYYPLGAIGAHLTGFVGQGDQGPHGQYGVEGYFEKLLAGEIGVITAERDASGRRISMGGAGTELGTDGGDIIVTVDVPLQYFTCKALAEGIARFGAESGVVVIMNPQNGRVVALCNNPSYDPNGYSSVADIRYFNNAAIFTAYEPGSVFKPITMAAGLDAHVVTPETTYENTGSVAIGIHTIHNVDQKTHGLATMVDVLDKSLNTGAVFVAEKTGKETFSKYVKDFGFGELTGIELDTEVEGNITSLDRQGEIYMATASFGQGITVTPMQLIRAYAAIANGGKILKPHIVDELRHPDGKIETTEPEVVRQVIAERTSTLLSGMLVSVVSKGHAKNAQIPGYYIAGKTGTAQIADAQAGGYGEGTIHTFIGFGPVAYPRFVILVKLDRPQNVLFADASATIVFAEIARYLVDYWQIPPDAV